MPTARTRLIAPQAQLSPTWLPSVIGVARNDSGNRGNGWIWTQLAAAVISLLGSSPWRQEPHRSWFDVFFRSEFLGEVMEAFEPANTTRQAGKAWEKHRKGIGKA